MRGWRTGGVAERRRAVRGAAQIRWLPGWLVLCAVLLGLAAPVAADNAPVAGKDSLAGPVTGLPLPRFVSMKAETGNARRGPGLQYRIDWVYRRAGVPLQIVAEFGNWRRVRDWEGAEGWMHFSLLSGVRTAIVTAERTVLRDRPDPRARTVAIAKAGVVGRLEKCAPRWCRLRARGYRGWVRKADLWGVGADEIFD